MTEYSLRYIDTKNKGALTKYSNENKNKIGKK
jgi:hypothetical protein